MTRFRAPGLLLAACLLAATAAAALAADDVIVLTDSNFDNIVNDKDMILVEFYAPWCGHCKKLAPEYEKAATALKGVVPLAKVDATAETSVGERFGVRGYPTLKIFRNGAPSDYNGPRDAQGIISYMKKQAGPALTHAGSLNELDKLLSQTDAVVLGLFANKDDAEYAIYERVANQQRDKFRFLASSAADVLDKYGYRKAVLVVRAERYTNTKFEDRHSALVRFSTDRELMDFVNKNSLPLVGLLNEDSFERYEAVGLPLVVMYYKVDFEKDPKGTNYYANRLRRVAADYKNKAVFAIADIEGGAGQLKQFGLSSSDQFAVTVKKGGRKFRFTGTIKDSKVDEAGVRVFLESVFDGKLEPYIKSEPVPADNSDPVKVLVAKNFEEIVNQPDKDVFVEFYAPWCGHCKKLAPVWDELGEKLEGSNVVIAKMDATANDIPPPYSASGFPTLYYKKASDPANPKQYSGERELKNLLDYVRQTASVSVDIAAEGKAADKKEKKKGKKDKKKDEL